MQHIKDQAIQIKDKDLPYNINKLSVGDRFYITPKNTDSILNEALVEFIGLNETKRKPIVQVIRRFGGYLNSWVKAGDTLTVSKSQCYTRGDRHRVGGSKCSAIRFTG